MPLPARLLRRSAAGGLTGLLALGALLGVPTTSSAATSGPLTRPNVVLIVTDDQTPDAVAKMPYLSSRTDWVRFPDAFVETGLCCPSRATILTGQYDTHTRVQDNTQAGNFRDDETLPVWLERAGYRTGLFGKYLNGYPQVFGTDAPFVPPGWTDFQAVYGNVRVFGGKSHDSQYQQYGYQMSANGVHEQHGRAPEDYAVSVITRRARSFIAASAAASQPFFAYFTPTATHGPWVASPRRTGMFDGAPVPHAPSVNEADMSDKPSYMQQLPLLDLAQEDVWHRRLWAASVSVDDAVRSLDQQLKDSGVYDDTVEIFLTDNGYAFGEHRWQGKICPYTECGQTPFLVRYPGRPAAEVDAMVSNVDLASTIAAIAGARTGIPQDGRDVLPFVLGQHPAWDQELLLHSIGHFPASPDHAGHLPPFFAVRTPRYLYVELGSATRERAVELYDHTKDPYELRNVAGRPAYAAVQAELRDRLAALKVRAS